MNTTTRSARTALALSLAATLTLAACGGGDDDSTTAEPSAPSTADPTDGSIEPSDEASSGDPTPAIQPASIEFVDQESDGTTITVARVELPAAGFIAVHGDSGGSPGPVIGNSALLPAGSSTDVVVTLDEPVTDDSTLYPMVHIDTDGNGSYEFDTVDGVDGPGLTADGDVAVVGATVTIGVGSDTSTDGGDATPDADTITISDFAFSGVTEITVGTTVVVTNEDGSTHTWTAVEGAFDSGSLAGGDSFEFTFTEPGTYEYFCAIHPSMTGTIVVTG